MELDAEAIDRQARRLHAIMRSQIPLDDTGWTALDEKRKQFYRSSVRELVASIEGAVPEKQPSGPQMQADTKRNWRKPRWFE